MLTTTEILTLQIAARFCRFAGNRDQAIRTELGCTSTRYFQELNALIDRPESMAQDPVAVKRLQSLRRIA